MRYSALVPRVDLSTPTYRRLLQRAESFEDSAEDVVVRLLDEVEGDEPANAAEQALDENFGARATPGSILPEREYWVPILIVLAQAGGSLAGSHVINALGDLMRDRLTPGDYEVLRMGEVRWRNRARFARLRMKEQGYLSDHSPRGIWEITDEGRSFLDENFARWEEGSARGR